jgi:hypothetical protein
MKKREKLQFCCATASLKEREKLPSGGPPVHFSSLAAQLRSILDTQSHLVRIFPLPNCPIEVSVDQIRTVELPLNDAAKVDMSGLMSVEKVRTVKYPLNDAAKVDMGGLMSVDKIRTVKRPGPVPSRGISVKDAEVDIIAASVIVPGMRYWKERNNPRCPAAMAVEPFG